MALYDEACEDPRYGILRKGRPSEVVYALAAQPYELKLALQNALERIALLEAKYARMTANDGRAES